MHFPVAQFTALVQMFHNSSWEIPLQASSSDYMLRDMRVERSQWTTFTDHLGSARIPLRQTFIMDTAHFKVKVDFHSKVTHRDLPCNVATLP